MKSILLSAVLGLALTACATQTAGPHFTPRAEALLKAAHALEAEDYETWFTVTERLAKQGDPYAMGNVAWGYQWGLGVGQDRVAAKDWTLRAATLGNPSAAYGLELINERGWPKNRAEAVDWYREGAERGIPEAKAALGSVYLLGFGVEKNRHQGSVWFREAAKEGEATAQYAVGFLYASGRGVIQNNIQAHMWLNLASAQLLPSAARDLAIGYRDHLAFTVMSRVELSAAQQMAADWEASNRPDNEDLPIAPGTVISTGTAFTIARGGILLTAHHVVDDCTKVRIETAQGSVEATVGATDEPNDLALLSVPISALDATPQTASYFPLTPSTDLRLGENIIALGFPLSGLLGSGLTVTTGSISALGGIDNDSRMIQISAPVQPGSSGGPVLDQSGNLIGMVLLKLNVEAAFRATGDIPQNVNFAITEPIIRSFLSRHGVTAVVSQRGPPKSTADVVEGARGKIHLVECLA